MEVAKVVIIGIVLVFLILVLLTLLIMLFPKLMGRKPNKQKETAVRREAERDGGNLPKTENPEDLSLLCVLAAAVAAYRRDVEEDADPNRFKVVAFQKLPRKGMK